MKAFINLSHLKEFFNLSSSSVLSFIFQQGLPQTLTTLFISRKDDPIALSVFGVSNTVLTLLFVQIVKGMAETTSLKTGTYFTKNNSTKVNNYFYKGLFLFLLLYSLFIVVAVYSEGWLTFLGVEPEIIPRTQSFLIQSLPFLLLMGFNLYFQEFATSLEIVLIFKKMNFVNLLVTIFFSYVFIWKLDYREFGFVYTKTLQELVSFGFVVHIWVNSIPSEIKEFAGFSKIFEGFCKFLYGSLENAFSLAMMVMGFEVCTYCAARLNVNELATWILFVYI